MKQDLRVLNRLLEGLLIFGMYSGQSLSLGRIGDSLAKCNDAEAEGYKGLGPVRSNTRG